MIREVFLYFSSSGWMFPTTDPDGVISYWSSSVPLPHPPDGYPPVYIQAGNDWEAVLALNAALREVFPDDTILVLIPRGEKCVKCQMSMPEVLLPGDPIRRCWIEAASDQDPQ